ncbi:hypothetical protein CPC735_024050 [Coccidioides posadasii C735 delta SOWgp]|uniref:Uncharacterized protein n=1 Tax=Coccidioides posadasii (strain C735) TaxID=222929 RepID=C5P6L9_COCP7|nr:hypothetical protein CPC735_024050 [Coccidioides posadasii C735 delta SOWgp]EER27069.1 hypothetical protein CPC735_024050 [Coccidioides posadasii C735 delta SOWgp]|eukprot:XP_003069214.1 hypothetical protein CPC735_024050 [Coccidioides posadasii C735 delta SOWgp]
MSGTSETFHSIKEQLRKAESKVSGHHGGDVPSGSDVSQMKSVIDSTTDKQADIDRRKANLPLPEQPAGESGLVSANMKTTGGGSGAVASSVGTGEEASGLREPVTAESSLRTSGDETKKETAPCGNVGRQGKEGLEDIPHDAKVR